MQYAPHGARSFYFYGNGLARQSSYNSRLQLTHFIDLLNNDEGKQQLNESLDYGSTKNNGNLQTATVNGGGNGYPCFLTFSQSFAYDHIYRLTSASDTTTSLQTCGSGSGTANWSRGYNYDSYGNMWVNPASGGPWSGNTPTTNIYNAHNQMSGPLSDAAGNQTSVNANA